VHPTREIARKWRPLDSEEGVKLCIAKRGDFLMMPVVADAGISLLSLLSLSLSLSLSLLCLFSAKGRYIKEEEEEELEERVEATAVSVSTCTAALRIMHLYPYAGWWVISARE